MRGSEEEGRRKGRDEGVEVGGVGGVVEESER